QRSHQTPPPHPPPLNHRHYRTAQLRLEVTRSTFAANSCVSYLHIF
ncbi:unnamed protein product, partial [Brassica oleracea]